MLPLDLVPLPQYLHTPTPDSSPKLKRQKTEHQGHSIQVEKRDSSVAPNGKQLVPAPTPSTRLTIEELKTKCNITDLNKLLEVEKHILEAIHIVLEGYDRLNATDKEKELVSNFLQETSNWLLGKKKIFTKQGDHDIVLLGMLAYGVECDMLPQAWDMQTLEEAIRGNFEGMITEIPVKIGDLQELLEGTECNVLGISHRIHASQFAKLLLRKDGSIRKYLIPACSNILDSISSCIDTSQMRRFLRQLHHDPALLAHVERAPLKSSLAHLTYATPHKVRKAILENCLLPIQGQMPGFSGAAGFIALMQKEAPRRVLQSLLHITADGTLPITQDGQRVSLHTNLLPFFSTHNSFIRIIRGGEDFTFARGITPINARKKFTATPSFQAFCRVLGKNAPKTFCATVCKMLWTEEKNHLSHLEFLNKAARIGSPHSYRKSQNAIHAYIAQEEAHLLETWKSAAISAAFYKDLTLNFENRWKQICNNPKFVDYALTAWHSSVRISFDPFAASNGYKLSIKMDDDWVICNVSDSFDNLFLKILSKQSKEIEDTPYSEWLNEITQNPDTTPLRILEHLSGVLKNSPTSKDSPFVFKWLSLPSLLDAHEIPHTRHPLPSDPFAFLQTVKKHLAQGAKDIFASKNLSFFATSSSTTYILTLGDPSILAANDDASLREALKLRRKQLIAEWNDRYHSNNSHKQQVALKHKLIDKILEFFDIDEEILTEICDNLDTELSSNTFSEFITRLISSIEDVSGKKFTERQLHKLDKFLFQGLFDEADQDSLAISSIHIARTLSKETEYSYFATKCLELNVNPRTQQLQFVTTLQETDTTKLLLWDEEPIELIVISRDEQNNFPLPLHRVHGHITRFMTKHAPDSAPYEHGRELLLQLEAIMREHPDSVPRETVEKVLIDVKTQLKITR